MRVLQPESSRLGSEAVPCGDAVGRSRTLQATSELTIPYCCGRLVYVRAQLQGEKVRVYPIVVILGLALVVSVAACRNQPLIDAVSIRPDEISPNADGVDDVARIAYRLGRHAIVSIHLLDELGDTHVLRDSVSRPAGGYETLFSGVIGGRLVPDGSYTCVFEATAGDGEKAFVRMPLVIRGGEATFIEIRNLNIYPASFTPNRDGISDRVTIGYYLTKEAANVQVYLSDDVGNKYPIPEDKIRPAGAAGNHEHDYEGGVDLGATPPADGTYAVVVEAEDAVGNRDEARGRLTIVNGGVPRAEIVNRAAQWSSTVVALGGTLTFTCTVRNIGNVGIRTTGPEPRTTYSTSENFNGKGFFEEPGVFRLGLDYEGNSSGRVYPFRWQLGNDSELMEVEGQKYLMPGRTVTVVGHLQIVDEPVKVAPYYWLGLIHEQVWIVEDRVEPLPITIGF